MARTVHYKQSKARPSAKARQAIRDEQTRETCQPTTNSSASGFRLDEASAARVKAALNTAVPVKAGARIRSYAAEFFVWCKANGYSHRDVFPAHEDLLCAYASSFMGIWGTPTVKVKMRALKKVHLWKGLAWQGGTKLDAILNAVDRTAPASSRKEKRPPVTLSMLELLAAGLCIFTNALDACVFMVACVSFYCQLCLGEILHSARGIESYNAKVNPLFRHLKPPSMARGTRILHIPYSKTMLERGDNVAVARQQGVTDPIAATENHANINRMVPEAPLASYVEYPDGLDFPPIRHCLTKDKFLKRCNEIWKRQDIQRFTGHSFRIGGTTHFLICGVNPEAVKSFGRWKSDAFHKYWRTLDALAVRHIEDVAALKGFVIPRA
ncbi:hypothetical protein C8J56DRAFT_952416 [Mycena floridula]|nr:hypothetical protein C8J56DRAFT_952416 [Mycena floridula]